MLDPVRITAIRITADRVILDVSLAKGCPHMTNSSFAEAALARFPRLAEHTCINDAGPTFAHAIRATSIPHLLEHLVIELQAADPTTPEDATFVGITQWVDEAAGRARVEVSMCDDLAALRAVRAGLSFLNGMLGRDTIA